MANSDGDHDWISHMNCRIQVGTNSQANCYVDFDVTQAKENVENYLDEMLDEMYDNAGNAAQAFYDYYTGLGWMNYAWVEDPRWQPFLL